MKSVTKKFKRNFPYRKCKKNIGKLVEQEEKLGN